MAKPIDIIKVVVGFCAAAMIFAAQTRPQDARSSINEWLVDLGLNAPSWTQSERVDFWATVFGISLFVGLAAWLLLQRRRPQRILERRAKALALTLKGRLRLAQATSNGDQKAKTKWKQKAGSQVLFRTDRFEMAGDAPHIPARLAIHFEHALALFEELKRIADDTAGGKGYVTLAQAAGRYVVCGNKLYVELAAIAGISPDWRTDG